MRINYRYILFLPVMLIIASCCGKEKSSNSHESTQITETEIKDEYEIEEEDSMFIVMNDEPLLAPDTLKKPHKEYVAQPVISKVKVEKQDSISHSNREIEEILSDTESNVEVNDTVLSLIVKEEPEFIEEVSDSLVITDTISLEHYPDTLIKVNYIAERKTYDERRGIINREAVKTIFIPKGQWMFGGQVSWNHWNNDNLNYLIVKDINFEGSTFSVGPYLAYFFTNNIAVGARFSYNRYFLNLGNMDLNLGDDFNIGLNNQNYIQNNYESSVFLRSYMPIGNSKIFGLFGELQLNYMLSNGNNSSGNGESLTDVCERVHSMEFGFAGGMSMFLTNYIAAELMLNVGGYRVKWGEQNKNNTETGKLINSGANFKVDLFSLKFGITYYL